MSFGELLDETIADLSSKKAAFLSSLDEITTLVIGSSHGDYGFDPAKFPGSFNFCASSQDLKHSAMLYRFCADQTPKIANLILFYSVFSPGMYLDKTTEKARCAVYKELFDQSARYADDEINSAYEKIHGALNGAASIKGRMGFVASNARHFFPLAYGAEKRALGHMKHNARAGADIYLIKILDMARTLGHKVTVVFPPVRSDYRSYLPRDVNELFAGIVELKNNFDYPFEVANFFDDPIFLDEHFGDFDHLLPVGPGTAVVTEELAAAVRGG
ncbi:MAG TPA: hypothetical protein VFW13_10465 [Phenylobacterium sp.]|nr:hypothetical protein [Phenylobacterium sp.]